MSKILGIDYGQSKIGLALGSGEVGLATPFKIIKNEANIIDKIKEICGEEGINVVVIGKLRNRNKKFDNFINSLNSLGLRVELADERLTTKMASKVQPAGSPRSLGRRQDDAVAASLILQSWLDKK